MVAIQSKRTRELNKRFSDFENLVLMITRAALAFTSGDDTKHKNDDNKNNTRRWGFIHKR